MKLKNKKTGEIGEIGYIGSSSGKLTVKPINGVACESAASYSSLAELNAEWGDYEEPKEDGIDHIITLVEAYSSHDSERYPKEIVEKLKAWKRLKDKGFRFTGWKCTGGIEFTFDNYVDKGERTESAVDDLDLLFGGEE